MKEVFTAIYRGNLWSGRQSRSGTGSDLEETNIIRDKLPQILKEYDIGTLVDIPCGDMNWMIEVVRKCQDIDFICLDIVSELIKENDDKYLEPNLIFSEADITEKIGYIGDMIFVRDCLGHLSNAHVDKAVENIKRANPKYLMATHWPGVVGEPDIIDGGWRPINMDHFLGPEWEQVDYIEEDIKDKGMGIWKLNSKQS